MHTFFPVIQKDELIFSIYARYHERSLNKTVNHTLEELGLTKIEPLIPQNISSLIEKLKYFDVPDINYFLSSHTLYNYFLNFISSIHHKNIYQYMVYGSGKIESEIRRQVFAFHPTFCYCPICFITDFEETGESYWRISHQIPTVFICPIHHCPLEKINTPYYEMNLKSKVDINVHHILKRSLSKKTLFYAKKFARQSFYLNKINLMLYNKAKSQKFYLLFIQGGFVNSSGTPDVTKLKTEIDKFFGIEFLKLAKFNEGIYEAMEKNPLLWEHKMSPVEFLVLVNFFFDSLSNFIIYNYKTPTGENGPFPCLNYFCEYFRLNTITSTSLYIKENNTKALSINFKCNKCDFRYEKVYRISDWRMIEKIRHNPEEWQSNVLTLINNNFRIETVAKKLNINTLEIEEIICKNKMNQSVKILKEYNNSLDWVKRDKQVLLYLKELVSTAICRGKVEVYPWIIHRINTTNLKSELTFLIRTNQYIEKHRRLYNKIKPNNYYGRHTHI